MHGSLTVWRHGKQQVVTVAYMYVSATYIDISLFINLEVTGLV